MYSIYRSRRCRNRSEPPGSDRSPRQRPPGSTNRMRIRVPQGAVGGPQGSTVVAHDSCFNPPTVLNFNPWDSKASSLNLWYIWNCIIVRNWRYLASVCNFILVSHLTLEGRNLSFIPIDDQSVIWCTAFDDLNCTCIQTLFQNSAISLI